MSRHLRVLVLACVAAGVAFSWPLALHPAGREPVSGFTDGHLVGFGLQAREWAAGRFGPHTDAVAWPHGAALRTLLWPGSVLALATGPVAALALLVVGTPLLNGLSGWLLGRRLGLGDDGRLVLGLLLAWNPWVCATLQNGQVEQAVIGGAALMWAAPRWALLPVTALVGLAAPHVALAGCLGVPFAFRGSPVAVAGAALGAVAVNAWHAPGLDPGGVSVFAPFGMEATKAGAPLAKDAARLVDLVLPATMPPAKTNPVVHLGYLGAPALVAGIAAGRRHPWWLGIGVAAVWLALGPGYGAYDLLARAVPSIARSGTPYRFLIAAWVALPALIATLPRRWALGLVAWTWCEPAWVDPRPLRLPTQPHVVDASSLALRGGAGWVLDLPISGIGCQFQNGHALVQALVHRRPVPVVLRSGFDGWPYLAYRARAVDAALRAPDCAGRVRDAVGDASAVVGHLHGRCKLLLPQQECLTTALGPPERGEAVVWWTLR